MTKTPARRGARRVHARQAPAFVPCSPGTYLARYRDGIYEPFPVHVYDDGAGLVAVLPSGVVTLREPAFASLEWSHVGDVEHVAQADQVAA